MAESDNRSLNVSLYIIDQIFGVLRVAVPWGFVFGIAWQAQIAVGHLAGEETQIWAHLYAYIKTPSNFWSKILPWGIVFLCSIWALLERKLRYRTIGHIGDRPKTLEVQIDRSRTSSGLTPEGRPNRRDF